MMPADRKPFLEIVLGFAELKGKQLTAPALELYWNSMQHWSLEDFREAAEHLVRTEKFFPGPDAFEALRNAGRETAGEAWASIRQYLKWTVNGYQLEADTPDLIARCISAIGGANAIAMCEEEKLHFLERRFCEHYETMQDSDDVRRAVPRIAISGLRRLSSQHRPALEYETTDNQFEG